MDWYAFENPYANDEPTYFIAEDEETGKIIGYLGRAPNRFVINGKPHQAYFAHDLYVHPDYRNMGIFITMSLYKAIEDACKSFCCLVWTTDLNLEFQKRRGYHELKAGLFVKVFDPKKMLVKAKGESTLVNILSSCLKTSMICLWCRRPTG